MAANRNLLTSVVSAWRNVVNRFQLIRSNKVTLTITMVKDPSKGSGGGSDHDYPFKKATVHTPKFEVVAKHLNSGLRKFYQDVQVTVVECPDLKQPPFNLAQNGLSGNTKIADIGGMNYLVPVAKKEKQYSMKKLAKVMGMSRACFIGAGAAPHQVLGFNSEMFPSVVLENDNVVDNKSCYVKVDSNGDSEIGSVDSEEFSLMMNLYASEGTPGNVLKITTKKRIGKEIGFSSAIRTVLKEEFKDKTVSLGGVFLIKSGRAKVHLMPDFTEKELKTDDDLKGWLKYYDVNAPLVCATVLHSHDPGLGLRLDHTHCVSDHKDGGHYYYDTTPDDVEYEGYFNMASEVYRFDPPEETIQL